MLSLKGSPAKSSVNAKEPSQQLPKQNLGVPEQTSDITTAREARKNMRRVFNYVTRSFSYVPSTILDPCPSKATEETRAEKGWCKNKSPSQRKAAKKEKAKEALAAMTEEEVAAAAQSTDDLILAECAKELLKANEEKPGTDDESEDEATQADAAPKTGKKKRRRRQCKNKPTTNEA